MDLYNPNYYIDAADDAAMIQAAVDAAAAAGANVTIPRHNLRTGKDIWMLPRAILLHTGTTLVLDNCHLRQCDGIFDNLFRNSNGRTEAASTLAGRQYDITIRGVGHAVLDGGNHNGLVERNSNRDGRPHIIVNTTMHFHNCERVIIDNVNILHQRWWGITFHYCSNSRVSNIRFMSIGSAPNADGIDLRTGCNGFVIENISGYTQDDSVALTCLDHGFDASMRVEDLDDSIHNVVVRNITTACMCAQVRLLNQDHKKLYNVLIENVQNYCEYDPCDTRSAGIPLRLPSSENYYLESSTCWAMDPPYWATFHGTNRGGAAVRVGQHHYFKDNNPENCAKMGDTYNITIRNIQSHARQGVTIGCTVSDLLIDNVQMYGDAIMPIHFGQGEYDGIRIRNIGYTRSAKLQPEDYEAAKAFNEAEEKPGYGFGTLAAVYFLNAKVTDLSFDGVRAADFNEAVFAGYNSDVSLRARDVVCRGADTVMTLGEGIKAEIL